MAGGVFGGDGSHHHQNGEEVVMEGNDTYNPGQIREMADKVINRIL